MILIKATYICNDIIKQASKDVYWQNENYDYIATINHSCINYIDHIDCELPLTENYDIIGDFDTVIADIYLNIDYLPEGLFKYCVGLYKLDLSNINTNTIPSFFCLMCRYLEEVIYPPNIEYINKFAFGFCNFKEINLYNFLIKEISESAFVNNRQVERLNIINVDNINLGRCCFAELFSLKTINNIPCNIYIKKHIKLTRHFITVGSGSQENSDHPYISKFFPRVKYEANKKFIISQNHKLVIDTVIRHFTLADPDDIIIFGGGWYKIENNKLKLYGISDGTGYPDFLQLNFNTLPEILPKDIREVYYNDNLLFKKNIWN